ncbi:MAG: COX15/CtaA family protein [Oligoflexus sp.]
MPQSLPSHPKSIITWLLITMAMVYGIIIVGGMTRLTGSGLSMVEWKPIMGIIPPTSESAWQEVFDKYRQFPEYQKVNRGMSLDEFKRIFYWEYGHRVLGRMIGMVFFFPFLYFLWQGYIRGKWIGKLLIAFILGGLQGLLGWYMVKSGLVDEPRVSQYRLAAHLGLALIILGYLFWLVMDMLPRIRSTAKPQGLKIWAVSGFLLIVLQIFYGALTAGLRAGRVYNTFPDWNGQWLPTGMAQFTPIVLNFFENPIMVQLVHRTLAWLLVGVVAVFVLQTFKKTKDFQYRMAALLLFVTLLLQFTLGVVTLVLHVPISVASMHQALAVIVLLVATWNLYIYRGPSGSLRS